MTEIVFYEQRLGVSEVECLRYKTRCLVLNLVLPVKAGYRTLSIHETDWIRHSTIHSERSHRKTERKLSTTFQLRFLSVISLH